MLVYKDSIGEWEGGTNGFVRVGQKDPFVVFSVFLSHYVALSN